ncbi:MAG: hypothetical protein ACK56X_23330 [Planctomyces sp.]
MQGQCGSDDSDKAQQTMDSSQDARNLESYLTLKHYVQMLQCAMAYLLSDLQDHQRELSLEWVHDFATARRHRRAIDESVQRFVRMSSQVPGNASLSGSIRLQSRERIVDFIQRLRSLLPAVEYPGDDRMIAMGTSANVDWGARLQETAGQIESLISDLQPLQVQLNKVLSEKRRDSVEIGGVLEILGSVFQVLSHLD